VNIAGKAALVTGGASGLGLATARLFEELGASVLIVDLPSARDGSGDLTKEFAFAAADVTSGDEVAAALAEASERFGGLHVVVNCAGIATVGRTLRRDGSALPLEEFERAIRVNLIGTFNVMRLGAAQMARQEPHGEERGVIVNTASIAAFEGQIGQIAYAASKGGVAAMTLPAARDLASRRIRCVTIAPGTFDTAMLAGLGEDVRSRLAHEVPHPHRLGTPEEYAALAAHVVANPMLNGCVIRLDGALRMGPR
jgi:NAD(P)-dependent dehydrogenase (short-subunit alcohol dehydrogenase family)